MLKSLNKVKVHLECKMIIFCSVCQHGTFQCEFRPCPSMCTAYGDRHYRTFDGFLFDYIGACKVYLVKVNFSRRIHILIERATLFFVHMQHCWLKRFACVYVLEFSRCNDECHSGECWLLWEWGDLQEISSHLYWSLLHSVWWWIRQTRECTFIVSYRLHLDVLYRYVFKFME